MRILALTVFIVFASFKKVESQNQGGYCDCPNAYVQLSHLDGQDSQVIQSQPAVCARDCSVQVNTYDRYSVIQVGFMQVPSNMNVTAVDNNNNRPITEGCAGTMCDSSSTSITIRFSYLARPSTNYEDYAEISVSSVPNPYITSTKTWLSSSSTMPLTTLKNDTAISVSSVSDIDETSTISTTWPSSSSTISSTALKNIFPFRCYNIIFFALVFLLKIFV